MNWFALKRVYRLSNLNQLHSSDEKWRVFRGACATRFAKELLCAIERESMYIRLTGKLL